jgi:hypothetical protein
MEREYISTNNEVQMNIECYQEIISIVSEQIAKAFLAKESNIAKRARFLDADVAEITRQVGLEATKKIYEESAKELVNKKKQKGYQ